MPSHLGEYPKAATNREDKFRRAVDSFLNQTYDSAELVIVSDGCKVTDEICELEYSSYNKIRFFGIEKQPLFSGKVRQIGISLSRGEWITYLDTDDMLGAKHLEDMEPYLVSKYDWIYYNDYLNKRGKIEERNVGLIAGSIGTSSITHRRAIKVKWPDGYNHDYGVVKQLLRFPYRKIPTPSYYVMHMPNVTDE